MHGHQPLHWNMMLMKLSLMPTCDLALLVIIDVTIVPCSGKAWWKGTNDPFYGHLSKLVWLMCVEPLVCCRWCPWRLWSPYLWLWWMAMVLHGGMMNNFLKRSSNPQDGPQAHMLNSGWNTWTCCLSPLSLGDEIIFGAQCLLLIMPWSP